MVGLRWPILFPTTSGRLWSRFFHWIRSSRRAGVRAPTTGRPWLASCSFFAPAVRGVTFRANWAARARHAGGAFARGMWPGSGTSCIGCFWSGWPELTLWIGAGRRWTVPACPQKKGAPRRGRTRRSAGKPGTRGPIVTDRQGTPFGPSLSGTNRYDSMMLAPY